MKTKKQSDTQIQKAILEELRKFNRHDCEDYAKFVHGQVHCGRCGRLIR